MERLTRPTVDVDVTAAKYMAAPGTIPTDLRSMNDRLLDLVINGPTLNGVNKDVLRQLIRQLYAALKPYEDTGMEPEEIVGLQKQNDLLAQYGAQKFSSSMEDFKEINSLKLKIQSLEMSLSVACDGLNKYTQAEQEGHLVALPFALGTTLVDRSELERPALMKNFRLAVAYDHNGIVFHQPFGIFMENVKRGYFAQVSEEAERALEGGSDHA